MKKKETKENYLNTNSIVIVRKGEDPKRVFQWFEEVGLTKPVMFEFKENSTYDNLSALYEYCLTEEMSYVTVYNVNARPRFDVVEKYESLTDMPTDWDIISWSRRGDLSGWYPGDLGTMWNQRSHDQICQRIQTMDRDYKDNFIIIPAYSFGDNAFTIKTDAFPLFLDMVAVYHNNIDIALANDIYDGFLNTYHTKDLLFCEFRTDEKWYYPLKYNEGYRYGFLNNSGTTEPPQGFLS